MFSAASTGNAIEEVVKLYEAQSKDRVRISIAASSTLARQIANGAPADLFLSANQEWIDFLAARGAIEPGSRIDLLGNRLALITKSTTPITLKIAPGFGLAEALHGGRLALADPGHVPAGRYAKAALEKLGVWTDVAKNLAPTANVRAAVLLVARGEVPLGIAYTSDAHDDTTLRVVDVFPADTHPPIVYPLALLKGAKVDAAQRFATFLRSKQAGAAFDRHGFQPRMVKR